MIPHALYSLFLTALTAVWADCPDDSWKEWNGHCYRLSDSPVSWHGIRGECKSPFRADVASITSEAEQDFIRKEISFGESIWLGMRLHNQNRWWVDKTRVTFTNFIRRASETKGSNDVVRLIGDTGKWEVVSSYAGIELRGVCKMASCRCPLGWTKWSNSCYKAKKNQVSWLEAQERCQRMAPMANLVTISSARENKFVLQLMNRISEFWIGLNDREHESQYRWIAAPKSMTSYMNWRPGIEPNGHNHKEDCVAMTRRGDWADHVCGVAFLRSGFVCKQHMCGEHREVPRESARRGKLRIWRPEDNVRCPNGWNRSGNKCFSRQTAPGTFSRVQGLCTRKHPKAAIAVVSSLEDNDQAFHRGNRLPMWIASDGSFANWQQGGPATGAGCVSMQKSGQWLSEPCDRVRPGLCQVPTCKPICPADWDPFEGYCYRVIDGARKWKDGEAICQRNGGHLASILSQEENDFITRMAFPLRRIKRIRKTVFIGGSRKNGKSPWTWSDCSDWTISRWKKRDGNRPSFSTGTRATLHASGRWVGHTRNLRFRSVCKLDPCQEQFGPLDRSGCGRVRLNTTSSTPPITTSVRQNQVTQAATLSPTAPPAQQNKLTQVATLGPIPPLGSWLAQQNKLPRCPDGMVWSEESHFCITATISGPLSFRNAFNECRRLTAAGFQVTLPIVKFPYQKSTLMKLASGHDVWIGLTRGRRMDWYWHDKMRMFWTKWQVEPTRKTLCASMDGKTGGLVARDCQEKLPFFCQARHSGNTKHKHTYTSVKISVVH